MKLSKNIWLLLFILLSFSCSKHQVVVSVEGVVAQDSTLLCRSDSTIKIVIGEHILPLPLSSQIIEDSSGNESYVILDENTLYWFDMKTGSLSNKLEIRNCGTLNNYSGFLCSNDTVFVYNYKQKMVYMLENNCSENKSWALTTSKDDMIDPEALTDSPIIYSDGKVMLSGVKMHELAEDDDRLVISCTINIQDGEMNYGGHYPIQYYKGNFGGVYFNTIYHSISASGGYIYSFPADHNVFFHSTDFSLERICFMGSRYSSDIYSSNLGYIDLLKDKDARIKYFISQHSYSTILYDKYRKIYYRIAQHPLKEWKPGDKFIKPFSIIVMDINGEILSETPIQQDYSLLNLHNMHVSKEGLLIQKVTSDENSIEFVKFVCRND